MPDLHDRVAAVLANALDRPPADFAPGASLRKDLGIDSVDLLGLVGELEDALAFKFPSDPDLMTKVETVGDLVALVARHAPR